MIFRPILNKISDK